MTIQRYASAFLSLLVGQQARLVTDGTWGLQAPDPARLGTTQQRLPSKTRQVELKNAGNYVGNANYINYIKIYIYICTHVCIHTDIFESDQPHGIVSKLSKDVLLQIADMDVIPLSYPLKTQHF